MDQADRNRTIWQRIQVRIEPEFGREIADRVASILLPYVSAERCPALLDARKEEE